MPRPRSRLPFLLALGGATAALLLPSVVRINFASPSAPRGIYLLTGEPLARGRLVELCLPEELSRLGRARGYLHPGSCPGGTAPLLKRLVALPGDRVEISEAGVSVNGCRLRHTARLARDHLGRPIPAVPAGSYRVAPGEIWVVSDFAPNSWDSRYWGAVPVGETTSVVRPLWLLSDWPSLGPSLDSDLPKGAHAP